MIGQRNPAAMSASAIARARSDREPSGSPIPFGVMDDAGLGDVGREVRERADDAARLDARGDDAARIDALEPEAVQLPRMMLEVPPRDPVLRADDDRVGSEQDAQLRGERRQAMRLHAEKDHVGGADRSQIPRDLGPDLEVAVGADDAQAALPHGAEMRAACEQHDVGANPREPRADVSADRAGAGDDDPHEASCEYASATIRR